MVKEPMKSGRVTKCDGFSDPLARTILNSLSAHIALLDRHGIILVTNQAWRKYASQNKMKGSIDGIGLNYLEICDAATGDDADDARKVAEGIRSVIHGEIEAFLFDYPCHSPEGKHWYYMRVVRVSHRKPVQVVVSHEDITALKLAEETLREREEELEHQKRNLEEANIALKVLLKQRETDKADLERRVLTNIKELVFPYVIKLKNASLRRREKKLAEIIDSHLKDIISPFLDHLSAVNIFLTPQEMQIATLVRDGKTSKEIADIMNVSENTIHFHRRNLRIKFGLTNRQANLRSHLMSLHSE